MADFDFNCSQGIQVLHVHESNATADLKEQFKALTSDYYYTSKRTLPDIYASNMQGFPKIPDEVVHIEVDYAMQLRKCKYPP